MNNIVIGIDVGGTFVRRGIYNQSTKTVQYDKDKFLSCNNVEDEVENNICNKIDRFIKENSTSKLLGIGLSLAALVDQNTGMVVAWPNHNQWNGYNIRKHLKERFKVPIYIEDDANCGALGEYSLLKAGHIKNLVYISIGTGVGCGIIINGSLYKGENGFAGELGHIHITSNNTKCTCGKSGCFQSIISGPAIKKKFAAYLDKDNLDLQDINKLLTTNTVTMQCYNEILECISFTIYNLFMLLDICNFVIGGGVPKVLTTFIQDINNQIADMLGYEKRKINVIKAQNNEFSGVYGALNFVRNEINS